VVSQVILSAERLAAHVTRVRPFVGVCALVYEQVIRLAELALTVRADIPFLRTGRRGGRRGRRWRLRPRRRLPAGRRTDAADGRHGGRAISGNGSSAPARTGGRSPVHVVVVDQHVAPLIGIPPERGRIQPRGERGRAGHCGRSRHWPAATVGANAARVFVGQQWHLWRRRRRRRVRPFYVHYRLFVRAVRVVRFATADVRWRRWRRRRRNDVTVLLSGYQIHLPLSREVERQRNWSGKKINDEINFIYLTGVMPKFNDNINNSSQKKSSNHNWLYIGTETINYISYTIYNEIITN